MNQQDQRIQERTLNFAVRIVKLCRFLDEEAGVGRMLSKQIIRSGTSIGANVRESQSAQSDKDFLHKMEIALKEARETEYWLLVLVKSEIIPDQKVQSLREENEVIIKILVTITKKIKEKLTTYSQHPNPNSKRLSREVEMPNSN